MSRTSRICINCEFFEASESGDDEFIVGNCVRYAPRPFTSDKEEQVWWPCVVGDDRCGEFYKKSKD